MMGELMAGCVSHKVIVTVKEVKGKCEAGFKVGDKIEFIGDNVIKGEVKCIYGMNAIWPLLHTVAYGGKIPISSPLSRGKEKWIGCCPDPRNLVVFELNRDGIYWRTPKSKWTEETHSFVPMPKSMLLKKENR